ncbi:hypothetical protein SAMN04487972_102265 [Paracoccus halophilus]|uniref:Lipoprotein n=1 Tax=Paracoccus halophilus TaxID=376733 RepID=A0A099F7L1_9RHOB|nr:hypothetical protein [Paracoccus halophilus]KGJ06685.1 hypothetical protein IT41_00465 [Paracoccus halophilus]SFA42189.1 hypothetical protein SAMN04487972_102265 [Paracoccus halophilus]
MNNRLILTGALPLLLGACAAAGDKAGTTGPEPVPEAVLALAAPGQAVHTAWMDPADRCYWYLRPSAIETAPVPLPLRTAQGRQICAVSASAAS